MIERPNSSPHSDLLLLALILDYQISPKGMCSGISTMAMQAILAEKVEEFEERRHHISDIISATIAEHREQHDISLDTSREYLVMAEAFLKEDKGTFDVFIEQLWDILASEMKNYLDIAAFLNGVFIHQGSQLNELVLTKSRGQHFRAEGLSLTSPIALDQSGIHEFSPICYSFNEEQLASFLQEVESAVFAKSPGSKSMIISGSVSSGEGGHAITIGYDPKKKGWNFINSNTYPMIYTSDSNSIAKLIMELYQYNEKVNLAIDVYGLQSEKNLLEQPLKQLEIQLIENLKKDPAILTHVDSRGSSLLMLATLSDYQDWVEHFLDAKINPNQVDKYGVSLLSHALFSQNLTIMNLLLSHGANPNQIDTDGSSLLFHALTNRNVAIINLLLDHGADPNQVDKDGSSPLSYALASQNVAIINLLLDHGADLNQVDKDGLSPLSYALASQNKNITIINLLLNHGADPNQVIDHNLNTLMHVIANSNQKNRLAIFDLLIHYNGDIDKKNINGISPLNMVSAKDRDIIHLLAEKHAEKTLKIVKNYIKTNKWDIRWPGGKDIKVDNQVITVPTSVQQQWAQIELARANKINSRDALKEIIRIAKEVPESHFRSEGTVRYYSMFKNLSTYITDKQLIEEMGKTHQPKK